MRKSLLGLQEDRNEPNQIYRCKSCSLTDSYYGFGNIGWATLHDRLVHKKNLTHHRLKANYKEMNNLELIRQLVEFRPWLDELNN